MDLIDAIRLHRTEPYSFRPDPVRPEHLKLLIEAAARSPSHFNSQPWRFVLLREPSVRTQVASLIPEQATLIQSAPTLLVTALSRAEYKPGQLQGLYSIITLGAVVQTFSLVAASLDIGLQFVECTAHSQALAELIGMPDTFELITLFALGYLAAPRTPAPHHESLDTLVSLNRWDKPLDGSVRNAVSLLWAEDTTQK